MKIDSFLKIGHSHDQCQDYILTGDDPFPYIILADGCSQAKDSDIGARILCHTALNFLRRNQGQMNILTEDYIGQRIISEASIVKGNFNTGIDCLDATLIIAIKISGIYKIYMFGDGVVYWITPEDFIDHCHISYKPNAPGYLRYRINDFQKYKDTHVIQVVKTRNHKIVHNDALRPHYFEVHEGDVKFLMLASDGVESFIFKEELLYKTRFNNVIRAIKKSPDDMVVGEFDHYDYGSSIFYKAHKEMEYLDVCEEMTDFKNTSGVFLKRRVKKVMKNYLKKGFINDDDLSIGCFYEE